MDLTNSKREIFYTKVPDFFCACLIDFGLISSSLELESESSLDDSSTDLEVPFFLSTYILYIFSHILYGTENQYLKTERVIKVK